LWHHISDLRKVQEVDTIPRTTTVGVGNTYLRLLAGPHPALANVAVIAPPGPRHTMNGSAVVIGVDRPLSFATTVPCQCLLRVSKQ
jgi:hypothetical protein